MKHLFEPQLVVLDTNANFLSFFGKESVLLLNPTEKVRAAPMSHSMPLPIISS